VLTVANCSFSILCGSLHVLRIIMSTQGGSVQADTVSICTEKTSVNHSGSVSEERAVSSFVDHKPGDKENSDPAGNGKKADEPRRFDNVKYVEAPLPATNPWNRTACPSAGKQSGEKKTAVRKSTGKGARVVICARAKLAVRYGHAAFAVHALCWRFVDLEPAHFVWLR